MSSGQYKRHDGFNPWQIKNGYIAYIRTDGRVRDYYDKKTKTPVSREIAEKLNKK